MDFPTPPPSAFDCPDDWVYLDISLVTEELWDQLEYRMGGEWKVVAKTQRKSSDGTPLARGQVFISPTGFERLEDWQKEL